MGLQQHWSLSAGANQTADGPINWREGQAPSTVNDAARLIMSRVKAWALDIAGALVTGGTSTAYTVTTHEQFTSLVDGMRVSFRAHLTCGASPTFAPDSLSAAPIQTSIGNAVAAGGIRAGQIYHVTYYAAGPAWLLEGQASDGFPAGTRMSFNQAAAPVGWTKETNGAYDNAALRIVTGSGGGTGGSATFTTAFSARTIAQANLPNINLTAQSAGNHNHGGVTSEGGSHAHNLTNGAAVYSNGGGGFDLQDTGGGPTFAAANIAAVGDHEHGIFSDGSHTHTVPLGGSGTPLDFAVKFADFIVAQKA